MSYFAQRFGALPKDPAQRCSLALVQGSKWPARKATKKRPAQEARVRLRLWCACGVGTGVLDYPADAVPGRVRLARLLMARHPPSPLYEPVLHVWPETVARWRKEARTHA